MILPSATTFATYIPDSSESTDNCDCVVEATNCPCILYSDNSILEADVNILNIPSATTRLQEFSSAIFSAMPLVSINVNLGAIANETASSTFFTHSNSPVGWYFSSRIAL